MKVDCIIVGAGPAGSVTAKEFAEQGLDTLVIEKKAEIGPPKRCAEGVSQRGLKNLGITPCSQSIARSITGAALYAPSGKAVYMEGEDLEGYVLERKIFEKQLASQAIKSGARYLIKTQALDMQRTPAGWTLTLRGLQGEPLSLTTLEGISKWTGVDLIRLLRLYGEELGEDERIEAALARTLDQHPELRGTLEEAIDVLDDQALAEVINFIQFQVEQKQRRT